jgi:hypothetical protein
VASLERALAAVPASALRDQLEANARTAIGVGLASRDPGRGVAELRRALAIEAAPIEARLRAARALASVHAASGDAAGAAAVLERALAGAVEGARTPLELRRVSLDDSAETLAVDLALLQVAAGRHEAALLTIDAARERRWRAIRGAVGHVEKQTLERLLQGIPSDAAALVLEQTAGGDVLAWLCRRAGASFHRLPAAWLETAGNASGIAAAQGSDVPTPAALGRALASAEWVLVSAPPALRQPAVAALRALRRQDGTRSPQSALVRSLTSIGEAGLAPPRADHPDPTRLLIVAPAVTAATRLEIQSLLEAFPDAVLLAEGQATPDEVRRRLATSSAFYFSGHASRLGSNEALSYLELAGEEDARRVYLADIASWPTAGIRWAALAGCETGVPARDGRYDAAGLAQGLAAEWKAPVFATLAPLADADAVAFATETLASVRGGSPDRTFAYLFLR